jgi:hypothetical protein
MCYIFLIFVDFIVTLTSLNRLLVVVAFSFSKLVIIANRLQQFNNQRNAGLVYSTIFNNLLFSITGYTCYCQQSGIIYTQRTSPVGIVNYAAPVSAIGLGTDKFIDGYVRTYGSTTFIFPVGDNGSRRPFAAAADGTMGAYFGVDPSVAITSNPAGGDYAPLPTGAPFSKDSKDGDIRAISSSEYWDINGTNPTKITLTCIE